MTTMFVAFYPAYPPASGAASVTWNLAKYWGGERLLLQIGAEASLRKLNGVKILTLPGFAEGRIAKLAGLRRRIRTILQHVREVKPDLLVLEGASWAVYHAILLQRLRSLLPELEVYYHSHNVEYELRRQKHGSLVIWLTKLAEGYVLRNSDRVFAVSETDRRQFESLYGVSSELLPNGVDASSFERLDRGENIDAEALFNVGRSAVLFLGSYAYRPNKEAIDFLIEEVMPRVIQEVPGSQLVVLGGDVPFGYRWLVNPGCVPASHIPVFTRSCAVGVAPIFSGSGTRLKILEYLAGGLPVVCTRKGAEGLEVEEGRHLQFAERSQEFVVTICELLKNPERREELGSSGRQLVCEKYSWQSIIERLVL